MFRSCCLLVLLVSLCRFDSAQTTDAPLIPSHPATADQIKEYWSQTHAIEAAHKLMNQMVNTAQATSAPYLTKSFWDDMRSSAQALDIEGPMILAYQKYFSEEDMHQVILFNKTPAGQHLLAAQALISSAAGDELRKAGEEMGRQVYLRHKEEIEAAKARYDADILAKQNSSKKLESSKPE